MRANRKSHANQSVLRHNINGSHHLSPKAAIERVAKNNLLAAQNRPAWVFRKVPDAKYISSVHSATPYQDPLASTIHHTCCKRCREWRHWRYC